MEKSRSRSTGGSISVDANDNLPDEIQESSVKDNNTDVAETASPSKSSDGQQLAMQSLLTSLKEEFGDKVNDQRMAKRISKLSKESTTLIHDVEKNLETKLVAEVTDELQYVKDTFSKTKKMDDAVNEILETSAISVQKIGHLREVQGAVERNESKIKSLGQQLAQAGTVRDLLNSNRDTVTNLAKEARSLLGSYSKVMK